MFEKLTDAFHGLYRKLAGKDQISQANVSEAMQEVRTALLDADVHLDVVDAFCARVVEQSVGVGVTKGLEPAQEIIGIVHRQLVEFLGGDAGSTPTLGGAVPSITAGSAPGSTPDSMIMRISPGPTVVMMCGLQGSGKTTTCGKLAAYLKKRGRSVMLAAADLQRPAAVEQLQTVATQVEQDFPGGALVHFYGEPDKVAAYGKAVGVAVEVCTRALEAARARGVDTLILDTAGRLHVHELLMGELAQINRALQPHHVFLVVDAMTGQDAIHSAKQFHEKLEVDGIILTKFDSDTRGGAALSVRHVTGAPIRFVGTGEKLGAIEEFHASRIAGRILGMGDVVSLVEKAQEEVSQHEAEELNKKLAKGEMTFDDFLKQIKALRRMGPMKQLLGLLPGVGSMMKDVNIDDGQMDRVEAIIQSMTKKERANPSLLDNSRRRRIAKGSGTKPEDVGQLVKQFDAMRTFTKKMGGMDAKAMKAMESKAAGMDAMPRLKGSSFSPSVKSKFKKRK